MCAVCRAVMEVPTDSPISEEESWKYLRDIILGIEYCEYSCPHNRGADKYHGLVSWPHGDFLSHLKHTGHCQA
jgi:hypothetical protein